MHEAQEIRMLNFAQRGRTSRSRLIAHQFWSARPRASYSRTTQDRSPIISCQCLYRLVHKLRSGDEHSGADKRTATWVFNTLITPLSQTTISLRNADNRIAWETDSASLRRPRYAKTMWGLHQGCMCGAVWAFETCCHTCIIIHRKKLRRIKRRKEIADLKALAGRKGNS